MTNRPTLALGGLALVLCASSASAQSVERAGVATMIGAINAERARHALPPLAEDPRLNAIAESHSLEMARSRFFSHGSPTTGQPADRVTRAGLRWRAVAENIAINRSPEAAQQSLLRSPGHHENMVDPAQRSVGVGIVRHGDQVWVTQLFATITGGAPPTPAPEPEGDVVEGDFGDEPAPAAPAPAPRVPALDQLISGLGLMRDGSAGARRVITVPTPFGPMRVEVPSVARRPPRDADPAGPCR